MAITANAARHANRVREPQNIRLGHGPNVRPGLGNAPPPPPRPGGHPGSHDNGRHLGLINRYNGNGRPYGVGMPHHPQHPGNHPGPLPDFGGGAQGGPGGPGGWQGLQGIFQMLSGGGVNGSQLANLGKGYTGGNGYAVGGAHDAFSGLSPYAAHWLASSGILQQAAPQLQDTTGLSGDALFSANMMNQLRQSQAGSGPYTLHSGITQDMLGQMLGMTQGGGYAKGYNAAGRLNPMNGQPFAQGGFVPPGPR